MCREALLHLRLDASDRLEAVIATALRAVRLMFPSAAYGFQRDQRGCKSLVSV